MQVSSMFATFVVCSSHKWYCCTCPRIYAIEFCSTKALQFIRMCCKISTTSWASMYVFCISTGFGTSIRIQCRVPLGIGHMTIYISLTDHGTRMLCNSEQALLSTTHACSRAPVHAFYDASAPARALERFLCHVILHMPSYLAAVKHKGVNSHPCSVVRGHILEY